LLVPGAVQWLQLAPAENNTVIEGGYIPSRPTDEGNVFSEWDVGPGSMMKQPSKSAPPCPPWRSRPRGPGFFFPSYPDETKVFDARNQTETELRYRGLLPEEHSSARL
jgi:hypothetical protein